MQRITKLLAKKMKKILLLVSAVGLTCFCFGCHTSAQSIKATVTGGVIEGEVKNGIGTFKGIPFAAPPVGPLRWKNPEPVKAWQGIRKATEFAPGPMQNGVVAFFMGIPRNFSEDCLYLNVWSPATNSTQKLPVMVWIYGGAFAMGSTSQPLYDGTKLAARGVVFVSVAYRVGAFGFLAHPDLTKEGARVTLAYGTKSRGLNGCETIYPHLAAIPKT